MTKRSWQNNIAPQCATELQTLPENWPDQSIQGRLSLLIRPNSISCVDIHILLRNTYRVFQHSVKPARPKKTTLRITRGALSPFTLVPETPARRSCRRDKSDYVHRVPKRLSVRA